MNTFHPKEYAPPGDNGRWSDHTHRSEAERNKLELMQLHLGTFVPLAIAEIVRRGGPTEHDWEIVRGWARPTKVTLPNGDVRDQMPAMFSELMLFGDPKQRGVAAEGMGQMVEAVALMAFCPGGIKLFGLHFDAKGWYKQQDKPTKRPKRLAPKRQRRQ